MLCGSYIGESLWAYTAVSWRVISVNTYVTTCKETAFNTTVGVGNRLNNEDL